MVWPLLARGASFAGRHWFMTGTAAHIATDGKSTDFLLNQAGTVLGNPTEQDTVSRQVLERLGIPGDMLDKANQLGDGLGHLKAMGAGLFGKLGEMLEKLFSYLAEALGGLTQSMGIMPSSEAGFTVAPRTGMNPEAIVQGSGRLAADLVANTAGHDPATPEGRAALNMGSIYRVQHDASPDDISTMKIGDLTSVAQLERKADWEHKNSLSGPSVNNAPGPDMDFTA